MTVTRSWWPRTSEGASAIPENPAKVSETPRRRGSCRAPMPSRTESLLRYRAEADALSCLHQGFQPSQFPSPPPSGGSRIMGRTQRQVRIGRQLRHPALPPRLVVVEVVKGLESRYLAALFEEQIFKLTYAMRLQFMDSVHPSAPWKANSISDEHTSQPSTWPTLSMPTVPVAWSILIKPPRVMGRVFSARTTLSISCATVTEISFTVSDETSVGLTCPSATAGGVVESKQPR